MQFITLETASAFQEAVASVSSPQRLVVCGSLEDQEYIEEGMAASCQSIENIIDEAKGIDVEAWFDMRKKSLEKELGSDITQSVGTWSGEAEMKQGFTLTFDMLSGLPHSHLVGARIENKTSWEIPAYFKFGGWNDCPNPELHCAIWQYWQEKYGAHLVGVSNDVLEAYVLNPPSTEKEAMDLAWQQYLYCSDVVDQGVETVSNLAASIINHHAWYFWWD